MRPPPAQIGELLRLTLDTLAYRHRLSPELFALKAVEWWGDRERVRPIEFIWFIQRYSIRWNHGGFVTPSVGQTDPSVAVPTPAYSGGPDPR